LVSAEESRTRKTSGIKYGGKITSVYLLGDLCQYV
jgi:hypothetical protein